MYCFNKGCYHNEFYVCDWDMFWTSHPDAGKHALLRANQS